MDGRPGSPAIKATPRQALDQAYQGLTLYIYI